MNLRKLFAILAVAILGISGVASANPIIRLTTSEGETATVVDEDANDKCDNAIGCVTWIGGLGKWNFNVTTGIGTPPLGPTPHLDLNSVNFSNSDTGAGSSITLELTQTGFTEGIGAAAAFLAEIGGTLANAGVLQWFLFVDLDDQPFGTGITVATDTTAVSPFAQTGSDSILLSGQSYAITLRVIVTHPDGISNTSFDFSGRMVPEPGTLLLIGASLIGIALVRRKIA